MKHADRVTDGPMNKEATKIEVLLDVIEEAGELISGEEAGLLFHKLDVLPEKLLAAHRKDLAGRAVLVREELAHRTAPVY